MKDWTGNRKSVFATLGASNHSKQERESLDYYATESRAIDLLAAKFTIPHKVWECACGGGSLSDRLKELGHEVISTDIIDRGYGGFDGICDFLSPMFHPQIDGDFCILTNPPYKFVTEFVLTALDILPSGGYACFFLKTTALESRGRYENIFRNTPPTIFSSSLTESCAPRTESLRMRGRTSVQGRRHTPGWYGRKATKVRRY